jgi:hypothetical protein
VRRADDERHTRHAFVDEEAVRLLAMIAEAFAVVAHDYDDRAIEEVVCVQVRDDAAHLRVGEGNLCIVRAAAQTGGVRFRRFVRRVRIVQVEPAEEARAACAVEPPQCLVHDFVRRPLDVPQRDPAVLRQVEVVEVRVEPLIEPPLRVQDVGRHERAGSDLPLFQELREREL